MSETIRIPALEQCALSSDIAENGDIVLTLKHWWNGFLIEVKDELPAKYQKMGYRARRAMMNEVVRRVQFQLAEKIRQLRTQCQMEIILN